MAPRLHIVIVNYCLTDMVADCLRSLETEVGASIEVTVVDNASPDGSHEKLLKLIPDNGWDRFAKLVLSPKNGGFAYGNNVGIRPVFEGDNPPEYFMLLNPDTQVRPGAIKTLMDFLQEHPAAGIVGPRIVSPDGSPQRSAFRFPSLPGELTRGLCLNVVSKALDDYVPAPVCRDDIHQTDWVSGAAMMMRREVIEKVGLMDDEYFLYYEETDYCLQAHRQGFECWHLPTAEIVHDAGSSTGVAGDDESITPQRRLPRYWNESRHRYFYKNHGAAIANAADVIFGVTSASKRVRMRMLGKLDLSPPQMVRDLLRFRLEEAGLLSRNTP